MTTETGSELTRIDIVAAAARHRCSVHVIRSRIKDGTLFAVKERVNGRDGRPVLKTMVSVEELDAVFAAISASAAANERRIAQVSAAAPRFTEAQKATIAVILKVASTLRDAHGSEGRS